MFGFVLVLGKINKHIQPILFTYMEPLFCERHSISKPSTYTVAESTQIWYDNFLPL